MTHVRWMRKADRRDYAASLSFLTLTRPPHTAKKIVKALKKAPLRTFAAKDIFRASEVPLLGAENIHVRKDITRIRTGEDLPPLMLVRETKRGLVVIADGYHRLCAVYLTDEEADVVCKIV